MRIVLDLSTSWIWTRPPVGIVRTERKFAQYLFAHPELDVSFCRFDKALEYHVKIERKEAERIVGQVEPRTVDGSNSAAERNLGSGEPTSDASDHRPHGESALYSEDEDEQAPNAMSSNQDASVRSDPPPERAAQAQRGAIKRAFANAGRGSLSLISKLPAATRQDATLTFRSGIEFLRGSGRLAAGLVGIPRRSVIDSPTRPTNDEPIVNVPPPEPFRFAASDVYLSMGLDWDHNDIVEIYRQRCALGFRTVLFCYDTIPIKFPHLMTFDTRHMFSRYFVDVSHTADRVVAISRTSRNDFLDLLEEVDAPRPPVEVIVLGTDLDAAEVTVRAPREDLVDEPFVLCVSTIEARKNHQVLYQAWNRLAARHGDRTPRLVIVGMVGWGVGDLMFRMQMNPLTRDHITILDKLPDGELLWLYRNCLFSVFPSLYEGWGLPVVESLALGKPCICSTAPAVVEAAQGFAIAIDPEDAPAWTAAIEALWLDENARNAVAARCVRDFHAQTWNDHAKRLLELALDTTP